MFKDRRSSKVSVLDRMSRLRVASLAIVMEPPPFFDFPPQMLISGDHHREKTISRQTNLKVMNLFDIRAARNCQDFKDTFIFLILCLVISTNLNFSPFCHPLFHRHMCMSKYVRQFSGNCRARNYCETCHCRFIKFLTLNIWPCSFSGRNFWYPSIHK